MSEGFRGAPNAEKHILDADALRRRQLDSALLHGSGRTWRDRRRLWPAATGGIIAVVVIVLVVAAVGAFHRQQQIAREKERQRAAAEVAGFPVQPYQGPGFIANVPADWSVRRAGDVVTFTDPKRERWLRIRVLPDLRSARQIVQEADRSRAGGLRSYQWVAFRSAKLGPYPGAEMEYTGIDRAGERRDYLLRVVSVSGRSYHVMVSTPDQRLAETQPILDEIARTFRIG